MILAFKRYKIPYKFLDLPCENPCRVERNHGYRCKQSVYRTLQTAFPAVSTPCPLSAFCHFEIPIHVGHGYFVPIST